MGSPAGSSPAAGRELSLTQAGTPKWEPGALTPWGAPGRKR